MTPPASVQDVLTLVRRGEAAPDDRLTDFLEHLDCGTLAAGTTDLFNLMVERGLLTRYQAAELAAGRSSFKIGNYRIIDLLGRGGMGQVFLAEHTLLGKRVALKLLSSGRSDEVACEQFVREARAAAALDHPNIVHVYDVNVAHDPPYLVMEYVDGISLQAAVVRHGTFTAGEAASVGFQVAVGLQQAAQVGLVHRDIKPANVLIDRKGGIKILDLGIARFASDPVARSAESQAVIGTLDYLAPEQAIDSSLVDSRADLYSLGATLFFLLAGHPPFADDESERRIVRKQQSNAPSLVASRLDIPVGLADVINRLLARSASDRYATPEEAAAALQPWAGWEPSFLDRLFQHLRTSAEADAPPAQLPPTRRITRAQTERRVPPDTTPMPRASLILAEQQITVLDYPADEAGSPTERITKSTRGHGIRRIVSGVSGWIARQLRP